MFLEEISSFSVFAEFAEVNFDMNTEKIKVALIGNPNVGKSALFNALSDNYAMVSNYPGTSVEFIRGNMRVSGKEYEIIDTPGMYSLLPITEEERVARRILLEEKPEIVVHVVDAKNIERMLHLTLQLLSLIHISEPTRPY